MMRLRASRLASTSRTTLDTYSKRGAKKESGKAKGRTSTQTAAQKREAYYAKMNVTDDTRVIDQRNLLYGLRLDPAKKDAFDTNRAKRIVEAMPFGREVNDTIVNAWLQEKRLRRLDEGEQAKARFAALQKALDDLEQLDPVRFQRAVERPACLAVKDVGPDYEDMTGRVPGLFPRQMRVPVHVPGEKIFDDQWRRPPDKE